MTRIAGDPRVTRLLVIFLRHFAGKKTQAEFGRAVRLDQSEISRLEEGLMAASEEVLRRMAARPAPPRPLPGLHLQRPEETACRVEPAGLRLAGCCGGMAALHSPLRGRMGSTLMAR